MAKTKAQLRTENNANFPNNNSQFITPEKLRNFNGDVIDAFATETDPNFYGTGSFTNLSGSGFVSASEFVGDGSKLTGVVASVPAGTVSGSSQIILQDTTGDLSGSRIDGQVASALSSSYAVTASFALNAGGSDTGSLLTTASVSDATITFTKGDASQFSIEVNNVSASIQAEDLVITVKNQSGVTLPAGTAVKATGVVGQNITIVSASADNPSLMPAIGVLNQELSNNSTGECYIAGRLENIDTSNLVAGAAVYVDLNGGLTSTKPSGSSLIQNLGIAAKINATEGELVIQGSGRSNDVPNIPQGQIWVGNGVGVATPTSTGSFAKIDENNTFTGTQSFNNISVSGTGSFGYIQSVTGSAKIIGDAYIILNNDTPTERYAGIKVQDSGSGSPLTTASLEFDGQTNDWFYEYSDDGGVTTDHGVVIFGPEYSTKGSPTYLTSNTIPKSTGSHHIVDSSITDDGSQVTINNPLDVQGNITTTGTVDGIDIQTLQGEVTANSASIASLSSGTGSYALLNGGNNFTGDQVIEGAAVITGSYTSEGYNLNTSRLLLTGSAGGGGVTTRPELKIEIPNNASDTNTITAFTNANTSQLLVNSNVSGSTQNYAQLFANNNGSTYLWLNYPGQSNAFFWLPNTGEYAQGALMDLNSTNGGINNTSYTGIKTDGTIETNMSAMSGTNYIKSLVNGDLSGVSIELNDGNNAYNSIWAQTLFQMKNTNVGGIGISPNIGQSGVSGYAGPGIYGIVDDSTSYEVVRLQDSGSFTDGTIDFQVPIYVSPSSTFSGSAQFNSDAQFNSTSTFIGESTHNGGLVTSGSIKSEVKTTSISSLTASIDFSDTSMFELTLGAGVDTHIDATNIGKGQTVNLLITQDAASAGTVSFSPKFLQPTGSEYVATATLGAQDILTLVTFSDTTKIYVANVKELS